MLLLAVEADVFDAETTGQGLPLWRLLMIASVEFGAANGTYYGGRKGGYDSGHSREVH